MQLTHFTISFLVTLGIFINVNCEVDFLDDDLVLQSEIF